MDAEDSAQSQYIDWALNYLIGDLLAMLPVSEKPRLFRGTPVEPAEPDEPL